MKKALISLSIIGIALFALLFTATFIGQKAIATSATTFIVSKAKQRFAEYQENPSTQAVLEKLKATQQQELANLESRLNNLDAIITGFIDSFCQTNHCNLEQESRYKSLKENFLSSSAIATRNMATTFIETVDDMLRNKAKEVLAAIMLDLRIFAATNLAIFLTILIATMLAKPAFLKALSLPASLLAAADMLAVFTYIFEQNWFYTILYSNYWGTGYIVLVTFLFILLVDIVMNKARLTSTVLNSIGSATITVG